MLSTARVVGRRGTASCRTAFAARHTAHTAEVPPASSPTTDHPPRRRAVPRVGPSPPTRRTPANSEDPFSRARITGWGTAHLSLRKICTSANDELRDYVNKRGTTWDLCSFLELHPALEEVLLKGDNDKVWIVPDVIIRLFGSGAVMLEDLKLKGLCFAYPLDPSMIRVDEHGYCIIAPGTKLRKVSKPADSFIDTVCLGELIEFCLTEAAMGDRSRIPVVWGLLIQRMKDPGRAQGYDFLVDPAFLTSKSWVYAYLHVYQTLYGGIEESDRIDIEALIPQSVSFAWDGKLNKNPILEEYFWWTGPPRKGKPRKRANRGVNDPKHHRDYYRHTPSHPSDYMVALMYLKEELHLLLKTHGGENLLWYMVDAFRQKGFDWLVKLNLENYMCEQYCPCCPCPGKCLRKELSSRPKPAFDAAAASQASTLLTNLHVDLAAFRTFRHLGYWKLLYGKTRLTDKVAMLEGFWKHYYPMGFSMWFCEKSDEHDLVEARNKVWGLVHQVELAGSDHAFGKMVVFGTEPPSIKGVWIFRGLKIPDFVKKIHSVGQFQWKRVDVSDASQRQLVNLLISEDGFGRNVYHVRCYSDLA